MRATRLRVGAAALAAAAAPVVLDVRPAGAATLTAQSERPVTYTHDSAGTVSCRFYVYSELNTETHEAYASTWLYGGDPLCTQQASVGVEGTWTDVHGNPSSGYAFAVRDVGVANDRLVAVGVFRNVGSNFRVGHGGGWETGEIGRCVSNCRFSFNTRPK